VRRSTDHRAEKFCGAQDDMGIKRSIREALIDGGSILIF
jgi:hypothetical protein